MGEVYILQRHCNSWDLTSLLSERRILIKRLERFKRLLPKCDPRSLEAKTIRELFQEAVWEIRYIDQALKGRFDIVIINDE